MVGIEEKGVNEPPPQTTEKDETADSGTEGKTDLNVKEKREVGSKGEERRVEVLLTGEKKKDMEKVEQLSVWEGEEEGGGKGSQVYRVPVKQRLEKE